MRLRHFLPTLLLAAAAGAAGCDSLLDVEPLDRIPGESAIVDARSARAALIGAYNALQSGSYYGGDFLFFNDITADNAEHTGTYKEFAEAAEHALRSDNGTVRGIWVALYDAINRANVVLAEVPGVPGLDEAERDEILGEAYFLRALHYHNLVRLWGDVPLRTEPVETAADAAGITRAPVAAVYEQITQDLAHAEQLISETSQTRRASLRAVHALQARVRLYQQDWAGALAAADAVLDGGDALAPNFSDLFLASGSDTPEDIFRVVFTAADYNWLGYYYLSRRCAGGRGELAPTEELASQFAADDVRGDWSLMRDSRGNLCGAKFPTTDGTEHPHVIRLAEVLLIRAEALAHLGRLEEAVEAYNMVRVRAGLAPHVLGVDVTTEGEVIDEILHQRRLELAFEGDRWADLVRTGRAVEVLGIESFRTLFPVPQSEIDVAPGLKQNPGYG